jgi:DNA-directed RNA polymerase subunit RPC12/RpoP
MLVAQYKCINCDRILNEDDYSPEIDDFICDSCDDEMIYVNLRGIYND